MNETVPSRPKQFLADLTQAMKAAAEARRAMIVEQARASADEYLARLKDEAAAGQASLRESAAEDVVALREQSKAQAQVVRDESERRVDRRRKTLDSELSEYSAVVDADLKRVEAEVAAYEEELQRFYLQLSEESDPTIFAGLAAAMPISPDFGEADPVRLVAAARAPAPAAPEPAAASAPDQAKGDDDSSAYWWMNSPQAIRHER